METYTVNFFNNSHQAWSMCLFQKVPEGTAGIRPLAWFAQFTLPAQQSRVLWDVDYSLFWSVTGKLAPWIIVTPAQMLHAGLSQNNIVTLTCYENGLLNFIDQKTGGTAGALTIVSDSTVPSDQASVGIAMADFPVFAAQAVANTGFAIVPNPDYWVAIGNFQQGQVLDYGELTNKAQVVFPPGVYTMNATLNPDNTWTIAPSA